MRATQTDYLKTFADKITTDEWGHIVGKALALAKEGDKAAREWITRLVLTDSPMSLSGLARREALGVSSQDEVTAQIKLDHMSAMDILNKYDGSATALKVAEAAKIAESKKSKQDQ